MKCTCGHDMTVEANTLEEAQEKMKMMMDQKGIDDHWMKNHMDDKNPKPTMEMVHEQVMHDLHEMTEMPGDSMGGGQSMKM